MNIVIIPARGGSQRIKKKNIKDFCGKPIIAYSIEAAKKSKIFDRIIVSTDSDEIANVSKKWGAEAPFKRPENISDNYSTTNDVMFHAVNFIIKDKKNVNAVCCLYPTAPFITPQNLKEGLKKFLTGKWKFVFSATKYSYPVFRSFLKEKDGGLKMLYPKHFKSRSQDFQAVMHDAGQFYWGKPNAWVNKEFSFSQDSTVVELPNWCAQDIDTPEDWKQAEIKYKMLNKNL